MVAPSSETYHGGRHRPREVVQILIRRHIELAAVLPHASTDFQKSNSDLDGTERMAVGPPDPVHVREVDVAPRSADGENYPGIFGVGVIVGGGGERYVEGPAPLLSGLVCELDRDYPKHIRQTVLDGRA